MPRRSRVPKYGLHKPSGQAVVKVSGRSYYLGKHDSAESREAYAAVIADHLAGRPIAPPRKAVDPGAIYAPPTVAALLDHYEKHAAVYYRKNGRPTSEVASIRCALRFVREDYADVPAPAFNVLTLQAVREKIIDAGHCRGVVNQNVGRIVRAFAWGTTQMLYPGESLAQLKALRGLAAGRTRAPESPKVLPVPDKLVTATIPHLPEVVASMVRLQRATGMRPTEVCLLRPCDIDMTGEVWVYRPRDHKTEHHGRERLIYIGPTGQSILEPYLDQPADEHSFKPKYLQPVPKLQRRYKRESYTRAIARGCKKADVEHWSPNQHSFATDARKKFGLEAAQVLLGHASADITQVYAERDAEKAAEVARVIG